ncbi:MAG TPA: hypothetical protein VFJ81_14315 [Gemmatimonadales bacterium]|nr:hypothetical protein [Gemmatimonadales bacterium]
MTHALSAKLERELSEQFTAADRRTAHVILMQYGVAPHERDVEHVRQAMLMLSEGQVGRLAYFLAAAQHRYQDVLFWAKHPDQAPRP